MEMNYKNEEYMTKLVNNLATIARKYGMAVKNNNGRLEFYRLSDKKFGYLTDLELRHFTSNNHSTVQIAKAMMRYIRITRFEE